MSLEVSHGNLKLNYVFFLILETTNRGMEYSTFFWLYCNIHIRRYDLDVSLLH